MAAPARQRRRTRITLREDVVRSDDRLRVDRDAAVIYGVKVLGLDSANGRRYLPEAARRAMPFYEGRSVRINHPRRPDESRDSEDVFGWLEDVQPDESGELYGNLHYLASHPMAERVCEAAERNPKLFGLSHNATGEGDSEDGVYVVKRITEVRSVDLVADPATTNGLFESRGFGMKVTLKAFLEGIKGLDAKVQKRVKKLMEDDGPLDPEMEMEAMPDEAAGSPDDHLKAGFDAACGAVLADDSMDAAAKVAKLKELLNAHEKLTAGKADEGGEDDDFEEEEEEDEECDKGGKKMESKSLKRQLRDLKARDRCRDLCEEAGVRPTPRLLSAMAAFRTDDERKALLEDFRGGQAGQGNTPPTGTRPKSQGPGTKLTESAIPGLATPGKTATAAEPDLDRTLAWLRN